jgi:Cdc6-like AAA superfamily ATPase
MSGNLYIDCQKIKTPMRTTPAIIRTITYGVPQPCGAVPVSLYLH